ncbi:MAG: CoA-binding protein [Proteobacteria bacterium]|nr:CoA-binding protein [Pseudomonadota bacterium]
MADPDPADPDDALIRSALARTRVIALIGASVNPDRPSHGVMAFLLAKGYRVFPVNPRYAGREIHGRRVVARLADIPGPVDMVDIFRRAEEAGQAVDEAIAIGAKTVWMQLGVVDEAAAARARAAGLTVIMDRCPAIEWRRLGLG